MPSSFFDQITPVLAILEEIKPKSVLDVGPGWGKYGMLLREYYGMDDADKKKPESEFRLDAVEGFPKYLSEVHKWAYNHVFQQEAIGFLKALSLAERVADESPHPYSYDLFLMVDVLDHFPKKEALELLQSLPGQKLVVVAKDWNPQGNEYGNELERHHSHFSKEDFTAFPGAGVTETVNAWIAVIPDYGGRDGLR